jgi:hypothetical protein
MENVERADTDLPVACTLVPGEGAERLHRWQALAARGRPVAQLSGHVLEVRYSLEPDVQSELQELAAAERQCCSFVTWTVSQRQDHVSLHVAADPERPDDIVAIASLFDATSERSTVGQPCYRDSQTSSL